MVPTLTVTPEPIKIYSPEEVKKIDLKNIKYLVGGSTFLTHSEPYKLSDGWCATTKDILSKNLKSITFKFTVDGISLSLDKLTYSEYENSSRKAAECVQYFTILDDWGIGTHHIQTQEVVNNPINDGISDFSVDPNANIHNYTVYKLQPDTADQQDFINWPIVYKNDFSKDLKGWTSKLNDDAKKGSTKIQDGAFHVILDSVPHEFSAGIPIAVSINSDTYYISVDTRATEIKTNKGHCSGLVFYETGASYFYTICNGENYQFVDYSKATPTVLVEGNNQVIQKLGEFNNLGALVNGKTIQLFVNGEKVDQVNIELLPGNIGLAYMANTGSALSLEYKNFVIHMPTMENDDFPVTP
jgi:hypothetical protein